MTAGVKVLELCMNIYHMNYYFGVTFCWMFFQTMALMAKSTWDMQTKVEETSNAVQNATAVKFSPRLNTNTDVSLEVFAFAAFALLHKHTRWPNASLSTNKTRREFDRPSFGLPF